MSDESDLISGLPDHLIHSILGCLSSREAVQTSVLSRRWKFCWTTCPILDLTWKPDVPRPFMTPEQEHEYEIFVDQMLERNLSLYLERLVMEFYHDERKDEWFEILRGRRINKLEFVSNWGLDDFELPDLSTGHLEVLVYKGFRLTTMGAINYVRLREVEFHTIDFCDEFNVDQFLIGCPKLRILVMDDCMVEDAIIRITSSSLTHIFLNNMRTTVLKIKARNVSHITLRNANYEILGVPDLRNVTSCSLTWGANTAHLLGFMPNLRQLHISDDVDTSISLSRLRKVQEKSGDVQIKSGDKGVSYEISERADLLKERTMEICQEVVKIILDGTDENFQVHANHILSSLEEYAKSLTDWYKKYGLHSNPTTLVQLPSVSYRAKSFNGPIYNTYDDDDSFWGCSKDINHGIYTDNLFGHGQWTLHPIRTCSYEVDDFLPHEGICVDSVPGTSTAGSLTKGPKQSISAEPVPGVPDDDYLPKQSIIADSVPIIPLSSDSPQQHGEGQSFEDSGPFGAGPSKSSFPGDSDAFMFSSSTSSAGNETPRSDLDWMVSIGPFGLYTDDESPRSISDPIGSAAPVHSSLGCETTRTDVNPFGTVRPFESSWGSESRRGDADPIGVPLRSSPSSETLGPYSLSMGSETLGQHSSSMGTETLGPHSSSMGSETPRENFDAFGISWLFESTFSP